MKKNKKQIRREFLKNSGMAIGGSLFIPSILTSCGGGSGEGGSADSVATDTLSMADTGGGNELFFDISLAEWSYNKSLFAEEFTNLEFPEKAVELGINAVEYVSVFFNGQEQDTNYLAELKLRTDNLGVRNVLIMVDREGNLGDLDEAARIQSVENHYKWVDAAKFLGCHSIRVNARGEGTAEEVKQAAIDGLGRLTEYGEQNEINVIVENHGGYSSNGQWLADVMKGVGNPYCGTLPDFGNFGVNPPDELYDIYKGVRELMPYAKGVSAKTYAFDNGPESFVTTGAPYAENGEIDYEKIMRIVKEAGFTGYVGIEYEGSGLPEKEGILATKNLLERVGRHLA